MQALILCMIVVVTTFPYLTSKGYLPGVVGYAPEVMSLFALAFVLVAGTQSRFKYVRPAYWAVFGGLILVLVSGAVLNRLEVGPLFAGLRYYLRALPFFLLPAVFAFAEKNVRVQLLLFLPICVLQVPIAWQQRMATVARGGITGDDTFGTIMNAGALSLFLVACACVLAAFYSRDRISLRLLLPLFLLILIPTTLNETKVTLVVLPLALLMTMYAASKQGQRVRSLLRGLFLVGLFTAMFIPIYDHFIMPRWGYGIIDFIKMEGRVEGYLQGGVELGDQDGVPKRMDTVEAARRVLSRDPTTLVFGLGIGNTQHSQLGHQFTGSYHHIFSVFPATALSLLFLEWGVLGLALILVLHWMIFRDALRVARSGSGIFGALAVGWCGVSIVVVLSIPYTQGIGYVSLSYLYWYFSGLIVAHSTRMAWMPQEIDNSGAENGLPRTHTFT